mmetsp:Transcript_14265/g.46082  ORF Transcript_14265/g.46082 Transcript_14265/m.46082 type:complete len:249 (-) Transcript_14265:127-873(-)
MISIRPTYRKKPAASATRLLSTVLSTHAAVERLIPTATPVGVARVKPSSHAARAAKGPGAVASAQPSAHAAKTLCAMIATKMPKPSSPPLTPRTRPAMKECMVSERKRTPAPTRDSAAERPRLAAGSMAAAVCTPSRSSPGSPVGTIGTTLDIGTLHALGSLAGEERAAISTTTGAGSAASLKRASELTSESAPGLAPTNATPSGSVSVPAAPRLAVLVSSFALDAKIEATESTQSGKRTPQQQYNSA